MVRALTTPKTSKELRGVENKSKNVNKTTVKDQRKLENKQKNVLKTKSQIGLQKLEELVKQADQYNDQTKRMKYVKMRTIEIALLIEDTSRQANVEAQYTKDFKEFVEGAVKYGHKLRLQKKLAQSRRQIVSNENKYEGVKAGCVSLFQVFNEGQL